MFGDDGGVRRTLVVEQLGESLADGVDVLRRDTEGGGGETDLLDEVADLVLVESHEPEMHWSVVLRHELHDSPVCLLVDFVLAGVTTVFRVAGGSHFGAAKQDAEVFVQVRQQRAGRSQI